MKKILLLIFISFQYLLGIQIGDIEFKGLYHLSEDSAKEIISFQNDSYVSEEEINQAIKTLFEQGFFKDIYVNYLEDSQKLIFYFKEKPMLSRVSLKGFLENQEEQQKELITIKKGGVLDDVKIEESKKRIIEGMNFKGTVDNIVEVETEYLDNGSIDLTFLAREGENIIINNLNFYGIHAFSKDEIEEELSNRAKEPFSWFLGQSNGEMKLRELEIDSEKIKEFYLKNGFLDVKVSKPFANIDFDRYQARLSYHIEEGNQYFVRNIKIVLDNNITDTKKIEDKFLLKSGNVFNVQKLRKDLKKIKESIANLGYAYVDVSPDVTKVKDKLQIDLTYRVTLNEKVYIRDVIISNNNRTMDRIIRREVFLAPKDLYNLTDLIDSKKALSRLGYFETVDIKEVKVSKNEMDLIVKVKESPTGTIQIGGGYSSYKGAIFDAGIQDRNIFGSGMHLGFNMQYSELSTNYNISLNNPRIRDSLYSGGINLYKSKFDYKYTDNDYSSKDLGFSLHIGRKFTRDFKSSIGYSYSDTKYSDLSRNMDEDFKRLLESYSKSSMFLSLTYDTTDDYFVPRTGFILNNRTEYAGLGGTAKFLENTLFFGAYKGLEDLINYDLIFRYKARIKTLDNRGFIPINESFHMGGVSSVRGYESFAFPDRDTEEYKNFIAKKSFTQSLEASLPISNKARLRLTFFIDYGWLSQDKWFDEIARGGYGVALEWYSPMAPIQFIFSRPFDDQIGDSTSKFEFTIGQRF